MNHNSDPLGQPLRALPGTVAADEDGRGHPLPVPTGRRRVLGRGVFALAAATILAACGTDRDAATVPVSAPPPDPALRDLAEGVANPAIAGEPLNGRLLRRFYARHGFQPVWAGRRAEADALVEAVLRADEHGLNPDLFHARLLWRRSSFPPAYRELLVSDAVLSYAEALARGAVPPERRRDGEDLAQEPVDVPAALDAVIGSPDPAAALEALAPTTPTYQTLRETLRESRGRQRPASPVDAKLIASRARMAEADRLRTVEANLERERWLPRRLPAERVWVNVADQRLVLYRGDHPVFSTRVIVGAETDRSQSPEFRTAIEAFFFNPPWIIPGDIVAAELLPRIARDPTYLARNNMVMLPNGEVEQRAGPNSALGLILFDMPNRFDVYLHDTPGKHLFGIANRRISHGCIRVEQPLDLAALLMREPVERIREAIAAGGTTRVPLPRPVPVFVVYQTAFVDAGGKLEFRPDFYNRDGELWRQLQRRHAGPGSLMAAG
jgi:murein L,D-transpeptidase YcbB/YkuD